MGLNSQGCGVKTCGTNGTFGKMNVVLYDFMKSADLGISPTLNQSAHAMAQSSITSYVMTFWN